MNQRGVTVLVVLVVVFALISAVVFLKSSFTSQQQSSLLTSSVRSSPSKIEKQATNSAKLNQAQLEKYLTVEAAFLGASDNISLYFKDIVQDKEVSINSTRSWIPASTIKAYVLLEVFRQRRLGLINFDQEITIKADNVVPTELETDEFPRLREGTKVTIYQLVEAMIVQSDNIAYNTLLDILDRRNINLALRNVGITETVVGEKLNLDNDQFQKDLVVPGRQPNTTTARDLATFFELLYKKQVPDSEEILSIFKRQKINNMIPLFLPSNIVVAHKTGDWAPIFHDGGVVYKPDDPFLLTIFTNSNDPKVIAKMAKVAYLQNASSVGAPLSENQSSKQSKIYPRVYLASNLPSSQVLAAVSDEKFPRITAADLGISNSDIITDQQKTKKVRAALIIPGSFFYNLKRYLEKFEFDQAKDDHQKFNLYLKLAVNRLSEAKTLVSQGNLDLVEKSLKESEDNLKQALTLSEKSNQQNELFQLKQINDLHYAVMADSAIGVDEDKKEAFVDTIFSFYQKNHQEITPKLQSSVVANPLQQVPIIGTINQIKENSITLKFDDGSTQEITTTDSTAIRSFHQEELENKESLKEGDKIAIVGQRGKDEKITPLFILRNIPKGFPDKKEGVVIEVNPQKGILKIQNPEGQQNEVKIQDSTLIKAKDTNVSLEGIKTGSNVTVFGQSSQPSQQVGPSQQTGQETIQATTVTVTKNSGGGQEKIESKVEPKKEELKKEEIKKEEPQKPAGQNKESKKK